MNEQVIFPKPKTLSGVVKPGLPVLPEGVERHPVPGGGSRAVPVFAGDEITLQDVEGLQPIEIVFFAPDGTSDASMIGAKGGRDPNGLKVSLLQHHSGRQVLSALAKSGFDLAGADGSLVFAEGSVAGQIASFMADADGLLIVCAAGGDMEAHEQWAPTEVVLFIKRKTWRVLKGASFAPPPMADTLVDINIQPGEAKPYQVKAGEYIQVLDVQGRECSDFQAFSLRALDQGLERDIDPTTTRSLIGSLYPTPGLHAKYFSVDQEPLVEIIQDTVGRHDTFGLACSARYYEDLGYPGHLNCSDNITRELAAYNIAPRRGWPAINFFFNTMLDDAHAITMDEPYSRPGDYVMMRALTDLICISTGCPCDVDPANGWNPTDIQVRTYKKTEDFKRSIGWRKTPGADMEETKQTGFHNCFARHTRNFVEYSGYWLAQDMTNHGSIAEYWAAREKAVIMDLSPLRKYEVTGPDAEALMQLCVTRDIKKLAVGGIVYTAMCYDHGGMIDDGTVFRLGYTNFRWIGGNDQSGLWLRQKADAHKMNAWVRSSTDHHCNVAVQGPCSRDILKDIIWTPPHQPSVQELPWFRLTIGRLREFHGPSVVVSRTGYSGELGFEVFCHPKDAEEVFDAIWQAGEPYELVPLGLGALDMLRIEAGLIFAGSEFNDQTDPMEAGIGFTVPLKSKADDFIGRDALERRKENPQKKLVGLVLSGGEVPIPGDAVYLGKPQIGIVTSALKSPILGQVIALARIDLAHSSIGTELEVGQLDGEQKRLAATIVPFPHFDPKKERVKGNYDVSSQ
jgi:aminomethyltransferase